MDISFSKTKIIATIGPASNSLETLTQLVLEGVDVFRLNFSHGTHEDHKKVIELIKEVKQITNCHIAVLQDLQGPKIRVGEIENGQVELVKGNKITIITDKKIVGNAERVSISYSEMAKDVQAGDILLLDDGKLEFEVTSTNGINEITAAIKLDGILKSKKGVNLPRTKISVPSLTEKDHADLMFGLENDVDWVALSFVREASDITELKKIINSKGKSTKVIAKIEKPEAVKNIDEIISVSDAIMVARGDLGVEVYLEEVPVIQKEIVKKCNYLAKPVIIATQMMESMIENPRPTRAETNDIANAVVDGADAVMLSAETASGKYPIETVKSITKTIFNIENNILSIYDKNHQIDKNSPTYLNDCVVYAACTLAETVHAKGIIGMTVSGYTAFQLAKHRPKSPIYIFSDSKSVLAKLNLVWGVRAFHYNRLTTTDETISDVKKLLLENNLVEKGDILINTASMPIYEKQRTNMVKLTIV